MADDATGTATATTAATTQGTSTTAKTGDGSGAGASASTTKTDSSAEKGTVLGASATSKAPEKYELKAVEGSLLENGALDRIASYAKERGLTNDQAQELVKYEAEALNRHAASQQKQFTELRDGWAVEAKKELAGGDEAKWKETVALANRVLSDKRFEVEGLREFLDETGYGNHKFVIALLSKIGTAMTPKKEVTGGAPAVTAQKDARPADKLYGVPAGK